ncbi:hypothetical protein Tco_0601888 [Tanacetum coccineum]
MISSRIFEKIEKVKSLASVIKKKLSGVTRKLRLILPYGMLLTRLFDFIIGENPKLQNESYVLYDRVMNPLAAQLEQKPKRDRGTRRGRQSTSSSTFDQPSSSHLNDDDDGNDKGTSRVSTPSPIRYVNSLTNQVLHVFQNPPNIDPPWINFTPAKPKSSPSSKNKHEYVQSGGVRSIGKSLRRLWKNMKK